MSGATDFIYWDSCVFCHYVAGTEAYLPVLDAILDQAGRKKGTKILTSALSLAEVVFASGHGRGKPLSTEQEGRIDELWTSEAITIVDASRGVMLRARDLVRKSVGWPKTLKPADAIHLATAVWANSTIGKITEIHTYDDWLSFEPLLSGIVVSVPRARQPMLSMGIASDAENDSI